MTASIVSWIGNGHLNTGDIIVGAIAVWLVWNVIRL
jgi:hypothetical protein